jgi:F420-dependent methylenetetrahydromethanopterin dehydrogenase
VPACFLFADWTRFYNIAAAAKESVNFSATVRELVDNINKLFKTQFRSR